MSDSGFDLNAGPDRVLLSAGMLARDLGVARTTILNWQKRGMPAESSPDGRVFDREACRAWAKVHTVDTGHGGRRPRHYGGTAVTVRPSDAVRRSGAGGEKEEGGGLWSVLYAARGTAGLEDAAARLLIARADRERVEADRKFFEFKRRVGEFVPAAELERHAATVLGALARAVDGAAPRIASAVLARLGPMLTGDAAAARPHLEHDVRLELDQFRRAVLTELGGARALHKNNVRMT